MISAFKTLNVKRLRLGAVLFASLFFLFSIYILFFVVPLVQAQGLPTLGGVAVNVEINDSDVQVGDIISSTQDGFKRSSEEYDILVFGVVVNAPIISVEPKTETSRSVISSGETLVRVSAANGEIIEGDLISTSNNPGVGQKATRSGYVIGKALQGYTDSTPGLISVLVGPSFGNGTGAGAGIGGLFAVAGDPANARYVLATLVGIVVAIGGTVAFIRLISTGVSAVGRNPLAKGSIYRSMSIAGVIIAALAIAGVAAIIAIIRLGG